MSGGGGGVGRIKKEKRERKQRLSFMICSGQIAKSWLAAARQKLGPQKDETAG
jgi:hypothetical protein